MSRYSFYGYSPYVSAGQRRANAQTEMQKLRKQGKTISPIEITGKKITTSFWGNAWCDNLTNYSDYANRMPRGRTYVRNGSVVHLEIGAGIIEAYVAGSSLYKATITIAPLSQTLWKNIIASSSGKITNLLDLLQGKLPKEILADICNPADGLFPKPKEIKFSCSCPDGASMCKHIAAVLYGVGHRLDAKPELFFTLRSVDMQELITTVGVQTTSEIAAADAALANDDLANIFGIELDTPTVPTKKKPTTAKSSLTKKAPAKKATAKKAPAKKATTKKAPAKKVTAKKAPAKKIVSKKK